MRLVTREELNEILYKHKLWLRKSPQGERAILRNRSLNSMNLRDEDLSYADLTNADLSFVNLDYADLTNADLSFANLNYAILSHAILDKANLTYADLSYADLSETKIDNKAKLQGTNVQNIFGKTVITLQFDTSRNNNQLTYWVDDDIITTGCYQSTLRGLKIRVEEEHKDNTNILNRYRKAIRFIEEMIDDYY